MAVEGSRGRYEKVRLLGEGGSGRVWLATDAERAGRTVALKELLSGEPERVADFRREFATVALLRHPNLAAAYDLDRDPDTGLPRFSLDYVDGDDLVVSARREGPSAVPAFLAESLRVLSFLHDFGFVHRDLKPGNLLVRREPIAGARVVLLDFGLAAERDAEGLAAAAGVAGTLPYLAPELFDGAPASPSSDLYALGAIAYEALHGRTPVVPKKGDLAGFLEAVRAGKRPRPPLPEGVPTAVSEWLEQMLSPDPTRRPPAASEALARLNAAWETGIPLETPATRAARLESGDPPGRDREIEAVVSALEFPEPGSNAPRRPRVALLCGDVGTGKTRLLRSIAARFVARGWDVLRPSLAAPEPVEDRLASWRDRAGNRETLVLLDGIETAQEVAAFFLDHVAREPSAPPLRIAAALRPQEVAHATLGKLLGDVGIVPSLTRVDLGPLEDASVEAMAARVAGAGTLPAARRAWLVETGGRNAFATAELLAEGTWGRGAAKGLSPLDRALANRIEGLSPAARARLEILAALDVDAPSALVDDLAADGTDGATPRAELLALGLARETGTILGVASRALAAAVRGTMDSEAIRATAERAARWHEERGVAASAAGTIARLWSRAKDAEKVLEWADRAATREQEAGRPTDAAEHLALGIRHLARRDPRRRTWRLRHGEALLAAGLNEAAARAFGAAATLAADDAERVEARAKQGYALALASRFDRAEAVGKEVLAAADSLGRNVEAAQGHRILGIVASRRGRGEEGRKHFEKAIRLVDGSKDQMLHAELLQGLASTLANMESQEAEEAARKALEAAMSVGHRIAELKCQVSLVGLAMRRKDTTEAKRLAEASLQLATDLGTRELRLYLLNRFSQLTMTEGNASESLRWVRLALEESLYLGLEARAADASAGVLEQLQLLGRSAEAVVFGENILNRWSDFADPYFAIYAPVILAAARMESSPPDGEGAAADLRRALAAARGTGSPRQLGFALVFEVQRRLLAREARDESIERELRQVLEVHRDYLDPEISFRWHLVEAERQLWEGGSELALAEARRAEAIAISMEQGALQAQARDLAGAALAALDRTEDAREERRKARALLDAAAAKISDPDDRRSFLARPVFRRIHEGQRNEQAAGEQRLLALYDMIRALNSENDPEALLASILEMALRAVGAERGMILLTDPLTGTISVRLWRNLEKETVDDVEAFSRSIVAQAGEGKSILALDAGNDDRFKDLKSVSLYRIRSLMCVPLRSRGTIVGTVYLDSRREGRMFTQEDLRFVEAFADHAALALENARSRAALIDENRRLKAVVGERASFGNLIGRSAPMQRIFDLLERIVPSEITVLVLGESGTGKELVAKAIHFGGPRKDKPFLSENCAAIPETLLESILFGHVRGAFTSADRDRPGLFEQAHGGTLFLDEVGDMSPGMQARLLRALQEGEIRRVGGEQTIRVDVRVIAATNKELETEVQAGRFREDLYYRLNVLAIRMPSLRERPGDVPLLVGHLLERIAKERGRTPPHVQEDVLALFERYAWPGNVRQLENILQRLSLLAGDGPVTIEVLKEDDGLRRVFLGEDLPAAAPMSLARTEADQIRRALKETAGNRDRAARLLGISRATIYRKIKEYGLR